MSERVFKLPDLGEGTVEAEIVAWHADVGDVVTEDQTIVEVMTDKASVEVPAPVSGTITRRTGEPGDVLAVGSELVVFETDAAIAKAEAPAKPEAGAALVDISQPRRSPPSKTKPETAGSTRSDGKPLASPAVRKLAKDNGIDLASVAGSGPKGRIRKLDLPMQDTRAGSNNRKETATEEIKIIGLRRIIAERMTHAVQTIPHFSYVEEVDVTALESLRKKLNANLKPGEIRLTYLPFIMMALVKVLREFPQINARYDAERNVVVRHAGVHVGIATQTEDGLKVPVVRHVEAMNIQPAALAAEQAAQSARDGTAKRDSLSGSTITVTSLGKLGGIATTPVINSPEVAIIGPNKAVDRPVVIDGQVEVRRMMNISSSFDHRFVDGYDAAAMIQSLRSLLESPATIFMP